MFNSLDGTITGKFQNTVYVNTHGIEWDVTVPSSTLDALPEVGQTGKIYTWLYVREDIMKLYGFASIKERDVFLDLLKVDGVGAKGAVRILSNIACARLAQVLDSGDTAALEKVPGVGKKTAAKMMLALKGRLALDDVPTSRVRSAGGEYEDVVVSLSNMGYDKAKCERVIMKITDKLTNDEKFNALNHEAKEENVFRRALVELSQ